MNILMIAQYVTFPHEGGNSRFSYILDKLAKDKNNEIELITSDFCHSKKAHRNHNDENFKNGKYKVTLIHEPGYKRNVDPKRLLSHKILSKNIAKYLKTIKKPDVIYCAFPSIDVPYEALKYAKKNHIRFILDIQDLWPEAFKLAFNMPVLSNAIFAPMQRKANYIYKHADNVIAVSQTYADRANSVRQTKDSISVFLGTDLTDFDKYASKAKAKEKNTKQPITLVYIGTLGASYNIDDTIEAVKILKDNGKNIKLLVMGDGPQREEFENHARKAKIQYEFTGKLKYPDMVAKLVNCDIAINPIKDGAAQSIINKVGDYAAAGLPVINTSQNEEYRALMAKNGAGINCSNNPEEIAKSIAELSYEKDRKKLGSNNRTVAKNLFDREKTYQKIINTISISSEKLTILHIASIGQNKYSGIYAAVPKHIECQQQHANIALINIPNIKIPQSKTQFLYNKNLKMNNLDKPFDSPDLVIFHGIYIPQYIRLYKQLIKTRTPYIIVPHGSLTKNAQKIKRVKKIIGNQLLFNSFVKKASAIQYLSESEKEESISNNNSFICPNGIDDFLPKKSSFNKDKLVFTYIGRMDVFHKGIDLLIDAIGILAKEGSLANCHFDLYGPSTKEQKENIEQLIHENKVSNYISLHDGILGGHKKEVLLKTDIFIQTSRFEGLPMGILEALSYGIPCVTTKGTSIAEKINIYNSGWTSNCDVRAISKAIAQSIRDQRFLHQKSINARKMIRENFLWQTVAKEEIDEYKKVAEKQ